MLRIEQVFCHYKQSERSDTCSKLQFDNYNYGSDATNVFGSQSEISFKTNYNLL